jgi:peptidoglycan/LPS O-acetylase OafA/YrhL
LELSGAAWVASRKTLGRFAWPAIGFIGFLVALQIVAMLSPHPEGPLEAESGATILAIYLVVVIVAALTDMRGKARGAK